MCMYYARYMAGIILATAVLKLTRETISITLSSAVQDLANTCMQQTLPGCATCVVQHQL